ncbi:hypothetical protein HK100_001124 [Physocladia obscura]|uniref:Uncharacterized protein n=1 Tax=Physocladia obscura TaxID=109957 RepID=A0AAD5T8E6_9FUNG|nr:hypothetical protein HK100_001124 [Physocladia obscura]
MDPALQAELKDVYCHIDRNEHKGGADARINDMEAMPCMCKWDPGLYLDTLTITY